jgi:SPP1 gp7 family putative phage head morphogenesis protein
MADSLNDLIADGKRTHAVDLQRFASGTATTTVRSLRDLEKEIISRLTESELDASLLTANQRRRLELLLQDVESTVATVYGDMADQHTTTMTELADHEAAWAAASVNQLVDVELLTVGFTQAQLGTIVGDALVDGHPAADWLSRQAGDLVARFTAEMRKANYQDGVMAIARSNAEALVRTSVQSVANQAHLATYRANGDVIEALVHVSTLDSRTTLICVARSGKQWTLDGEPIGHKVPFMPPPCHWRCRSTLVPRTKSFRDLGVDAPEIPPGTRSSMDGQVPADIDFSDWLKTKTKEFQDDLLGKGKAQLWRDGNIGLADLLDFRGEPLTLEELKAKSAKRSAP